MPPMVSFGRLLIIAGISLVVLGGIVILLGKSGVNRMPGTLVMNIPGGQCAVWLLVSIGLSVVLTIVLNLVIRFLNR